VDGGGGERECGARLCDVFSCVDSVGVATGVQVGVHGGAEGCVDHARVAR
jgi:hypothetical protein